VLRVDQIEEWLGHEVLDIDGERVGKLSDIFYSSSSKEAVFGSVRSGLLGRRSELVPLTDASVGRDYVRLAYSAEQIKRAGGAVDVEDTLGHEDAHRLAELYAIELPAEEGYEAASVASRRREQNEAAQRNAAALEEEAQARAAAAHEAQADAEAAHQDAAQKAADAERARTEAEQARAELDPQDRA